MFSRGSLYLHGILNLDLCVCADCDGLLHAETYYSLYRRLATYSRKWAATARWSSPFLPCNRSNSQIRWILFTEIFRKTECQRVTMRVTQWFQNEIQYCCWWVQMRRVWGVANSICIFYRERKRKLVVLQMLLLLPFSHASLTEESFLCSMLSEAILTSFSWL